jgi:hypothetical protein
VAAIDGSIRASGRFTVVMFGDRAVVPRAAVHGARGPCGSGEWGIEKRDREQTEASGKDGAAILRPSSHRVIRYYHILPQIIPSRLGFGVQVSFAENVRRQANMVQ